MRYAVLVREQAWLFDQGTVPSTRQPPHLRSPVLVKALHVCVPMMGSNRAARLMCEHDCVGNPKVASGHASLRVGMRGPLPRACPIFKAAGWVIDPASPHFLLLGQ